MFTHTFREEGSLIYVDVELPHFYQVSEWYDVLLEKGVTISDRALRILNDHEQSVVQERLRYTAVIVPSRTYPHDMTNQFEARRLGMMIADMKAKGCLVPSVYTGCALRYCISDKDLERWRITTIGVPHEVVVYEGIPMALEFGRNEKGMWLSARDATSMTRRTKFDGLAYELPDGVTTLP